MSLVSIEPQEKPLLIVDDSATDQELFAQQIKQGMGADAVDILMADSCEMAMEMMKTMTPCCCLVDYRLPDKNGLDFLMWLRKTEKGKDIPLIAMTGDGDEKIAVNLMRNGAQDYLVKTDLTPELLSRSIHNAIQTCELEGKVRYLAHYDSLTGLLNRALLMDHIQASIARCKRYKQSCSLLYIDVDNFKDINDNHGHEAGDTILKTVSDRIRENCRNTDSAARLGGDEFAILLEQIDPKNTGITAEKILRAVSSPIDVGGETIEVTLSIGVAHYPQTAIDAEQLIRQADEAMYRSKHAGKGSYTQFTLQQKKAWERKTRLEKALPIAIENDDLALAYQPIVSVADESLYAYNVSVRWVVDDEVIQAEDIIDMVSRLELSDAFHVWLIDKAFRQLQTWQQQNSSLKANLSILAHKCDARLLASSLEDAFFKYGIAASRLQLQFDEKTLLTHPALTSNMINVLHERGALVAINNFGSDCGSISHLANLPLDALCIHPQFFANVHQSQRQLQFADALVAMAKKLGLTTVAKGVEAPAQIEAIQQVGCDYMMGFYYGHPQLFQDSWQQYMEYFPLLSANAIQNRPSQNL